MSVANLTAIVLAIAAICSGFVTPVYLSHRKDRKHAAQAAIDNAVKDAQTEEVSWEKINLALVRERDRATEALRQQQVSHTEEIAQMRERHRTEINQLRTKWEDAAAEMRRGLDAEASAMKQRYDEEMSSLSTRLAQCQEKVNALYRELYELQKLLPPGGNPPQPTVG